MIGYYLCLECGERVEVDNLYVIDKSGIVYCDKHRQDGFIDGIVRGSDEQENIEVEDIQQIFIPSRGNNEYLE